MRQPSIVIHKGKKEDKYQLYVEDYVISFLKKETDRPGGMELNFYGCRDGRKYTVYGVGLDRHIADFDKYDLLEEICCRLTQTDPVFLVKEEHSTYEIKGYDVFYCENQEMQDYLIYQPGFRVSHAARGQTAVPTVQGGGNFTNRERKRGDGANPHVALSLQLGLVFIVLVAIVINSSNSFEKMEQLNQSAKEVFFVMENQEAEGAPEKNKDITVEFDEALQDDQVSDKIRQESEDQGAVLQDSVLQENAQHVEAQAAGGTVAVSAENEDTAAEAKEGETDVTAEEKDADVVQEEPVSEESGQERAQEQQDGNEENGEQTDREAEEGVEALSRNVARYYEVERGDTLYVISQKIYGDTSHVKKICEVNQITNPDNIRYGQKIILP